MTKRLRAGYTILEMAISLTLLALIFIATLSILPGAFRSFRKSEHRLAANCKAQDICEHCSSVGASDLPVGKWTPANAPAQMTYLNNETLDDKVILRPELEIAQVSGPLSSQLRQLTVRIYWQEGTQDQVLVRYRRLANIRR